MSRATSVRAALAALAVGMLGVVSAPAVEATMGPLDYTCSGPGFGLEASYPFQVSVDTDLPAAMAYGSSRLTNWSVQMVAPASFVDWAQDQGFTIFYFFTSIDSAVDGVAVAPPGGSTSSSAIPVPTTDGPWTWTSVPGHSTAFPASATGHHALTLTGLHVTIAFYDANGPRWLTTGDCSVVQTVPAADTTIDTYDVVAATTSTALALKGNTATATVTSNGAAPAGTVTFAVGGRSVSTGLVAGKATAKLPIVEPGTYAVTAQFVPTQPTQLTTSTGTASYTAPRIATSSRAFAKYRPARSTLKARSVVTPQGDLDASGRVTFILKRNGKTVDNVTERLSDDGVATTRFRGMPASGTYLVVAKYLGTGTFMPSSDRDRITLP